MAATDATKFLNKTEYERTLARLRQYCDQKESSVTEEASFLYRKSPDVGNRDYFVAKSVKGKTLVWNQLIVNGNLSNGTNGWDALGNSTIVASNGELTVTITKTPTVNYEGYVGKTFNQTSGHKYYFHVEVRVPHNGTFVVDTNGSIPSQIYNVSANNWEKLSSIASATITKKSGSLYPRELNDGYVSGDSFKIRNYYVVDLTLMFGAGNEPATVEEFESMFPLPYYDYNPGELISFKADGIQTVGRNLFDGELELGGWNESSGKVTTATKVRNKNLIPVVPGQEYYYTSPVNCNIYFWAKDGVTSVGRRTGSNDAWDGDNPTPTQMTWSHNRKMTIPGDVYYVSFSTFGSTYTSTAMLTNFSFCLYDSANGVKYIPYRSSTLNLSIPSMTSGGVQIFPDGMRSAGTVYDEAIVDSDGYVRKVVKRIGDANLGTFTWKQDGTSNFWYIDSIKITKNIVTSKGWTYGEKGNNDDSHIYMSGSSYPEVYRENTDAASVKSSMSGVYLYYELSTPVEYTLDEPIFVGAGFNGDGIQTVIQENTSAPHTTPFSGIFEYGRMPAMDVISLVNESSNMITSRYLPLTGGTMANDNLVTNLNADKLDGLESTDFARKFSYSLAVQSSVDITFTSGMYHAMIIVRNSQNNPILVLLGGGYGSTYIRNKFYQISTSTGSLHWRYHSSVGVQIINSSGSVATISVLVTYGGVPLFTNVAYDTETAFEDYSLATNNTLSSYLPLTGGTLTGNLTAPSFIKSGGTSSQFLKADGSVDSNSYAKQSQANNFVHSGNEWTVIPSGYSGDLWLNYRTVTGTDGDLTNYNIGNGKAGFASVTASAFIKRNGTSSQFLKADGSVDSNTYATAAQLTNGSVTKLGTATVGGTAKPIYLNAGTPTALSTTVGSWTKPIFLNAGTLTALSYLDSTVIREPNHTSISPTSMPLVGTTKPNRLALLPASQIIIEQTTDGGETWVDAGYSDAQKENLFLGNLATASIAIPRIDGVRNKLCGVRITITGMRYNVPDGTTETQKYNYWNSNYVASTERYCTLDGCYLWVNAINDRIRTRVYRATGVSPNNWIATDGDAYTYLSGWDGGNYIYLKGANFGGGTTQTGNYWNYRFEFFTDGVDGGNLATTSTTSRQSIGRIYGYGRSGWSLPNYLMAMDHIYTWDISQTAIFPNGIRPSISGKDLGTTSYRWNVFGAELNLSGNATIGGNITTAGYVAVGTGRNNGSYIGSDATTNIYLHNSAGVPLVADGLVVRRGVAATTATLGSATYPWAGVYSKTGNFSDAVTLSGTTAATRRIYFGDTSHYLELDSTGFHFSHGVYSDSFISAGGVSQSGGSGGPIEINTDDFAEVDGVLQLADRTTSNGMGYIILRKDMSFASQITKTNTIYEVRYSFNLSGASVTIPSGCVLKFVGGMLVNGTVTGTNTKIDAPFVRIFSDNVSLAGTWALDKFPVSWYGGDVNDSSVDISAVISKILEQFVTIFPGRNASGGHPYGGAKITLLEGAYYAKTPIVIYDYSPTSNGEGLNPMDGTSACEIEGSSKYGTYIHNSNTGDNFFLTNLRDGTHRHHWGLTLRFLTFIGGNGIKMVRPWDFHIEHCTFYNGATAIKFFATVNTHINDCSFYNTVTAIEFDSSMGGGGVSTTFTIENCWIAWCRIGFKLSSIRTGDGFEFIIRNSIFEYCRASLQVQSISERNTLLVDECYFEGNPPDITTYGNTSTIEGVDCYFRHCLTDPIDYGFVKNGTCRFYWEGYMKPKLTLGDTTASKNVTIVVDGKTLYNNYDNHIVKTAGFFDDKPGILYASEIGEAGAVRVNVRSGDDMNEGLWEWDGQGYSLSKEIAQTKAISYEDSSFVFSKTSTDATFEAWLSGDKNTALVGPWIAKLQAKFSGFTGRETPLKKLLATLGAGNNSALWQKIKHLHFPVLALPSDGANVGYDLITDTVRTLNSYTIYANRGVYPTSGGGNTGALTVSGVSAANISFFGIVTYRADTLSIGSSAAECVFDQGYRINFNKQSMGFINASAEFGSIAYSDLNAEVPIAFAMSANTGSARTICKGSTSKSVSETAYGSGNSYQLSGQRSYAATSVFAICDGLTPAEALTASTALATFAIEFGILGNSNQ